MTSPGFDPAKADAGLIPASAVTAGAGTVALGPAPAEPPTVPRKGHVCILSRKDLRDITRVPRMAKALIDAGYAVTVIALRAPVPELIDMCPETQYIPVAPRPVTGKLLGRINGASARRRGEVLRRQQSRGLRELAARAGRKALAPLRWIAAPVRSILILAPCTMLFKKSGQQFSAAWRAAGHKDTLTALSPFLSQLHPWAMTYAFAAEADKATRDRRFDVVQAHDNYALVAAARLAGRDKARLVYDAVELSSHRLATNLSRFEMVREWHERREEAAIFRRADLVMAVGNGVADWYARRYAIGRPLVVRNCRYYWRYEPDRRLRADAGIGDAERLLIWFGSAYPQQGLELLLDAMPLMPPNVHLAVVATALPRWVAYVHEELPRHAAMLGVADRVHFLPPRQPNDLVSYVSGADIGVIPRPSEHPNNFFSMPNKFLEMVMARLPIAASRLGDIVDAIGEHGIGDVFDERDPESLATVIGGMLDPVNYGRLKTSVMAAADKMTWEAEGAVYVDAIRSLMPPSARAAFEDGAVVASAP